MQRLRVTAFDGDDEFVFCHPTRGSKIDHEWYADEFRKALAAVSPSADGHGLKRWL